MIRGHGGGVGSNSYLVMYRAQYLGALTAAGMLAFFIILVATVGVNKPRGCDGFGEQACYDERPCGWLCASPDTCYCHPLHGADLGPLTWVAVLGGGVMLATVVGCLVELRATRYGHRYDAL